MGKGVSLSKKTVSAIMLSLLVVSMFALVFKIQTVRAYGGTITINADGSISPSTAPIHTADNATYTLTGNITANGYGIVFERDNITLNGEGYTVFASKVFTPYWIGIYSITMYLDGVSNVTLENTNIQGYHDVWLNSSSGNSISGNNITMGESGIWLESSSNNSISGNNITNKGDYGIILESSNYTSISGNTLTGSGLYVADSYQNSVVNNTVNGKPLNYLEGASGLTVSDDAGQVILVSCENITVESCSLSQTNYGIEFWETSNSTISGNNITNNLYGFGILLTYSPGSNIFRNNITNNGWGICLDSCSGNDISGNNITNNDNGILLTDSSSNNTISENNITAQVGGYGIVLYSSANYNFISGNNITSNSEGVWIRSSINNSISGNNVTGNGLGILLYDSSTNNSVSGNNITNNGYGASLELGSTYNSIFGNNIADNVRYGMWLDSDSNVISGNNITSNNIGISLYSCSNNSIFHNRFVNNIIQANFTSDSVNTWDNGYPSGGNYWSDYNGTDVYSGVYQNETGKDLIGDTPYVIDSNNIDHYPLVNPPVVVPPPKLVGDLNGDGKVGLDDLVLLANAYDSKPGDSNWNPLADIARPYGVIGLTDLVTLAMHYGQHSP